jgi:hypothetical protein
MSDGAHAKRDSQCRVEQCSTHVPLLLLLARHRAGMVRKLVLFRFVEKKSGAVIIQVVVCGSAARIR